MRLPPRPAAAAVLAALAAALSPFAAAQSHVAPTEAKSPADEQATFRLPPGFAAQLVASEPDIGKPIQMAFDARGRLWVTTSRHYPFPAGPGEAPSDRLFVLSDFGPDGKAGKVETFAADLNIPIGVLPLPDGKSCLVSHVGAVLKLTDADGDGKADARETVLAGFGSADTHGMTNSFTLMPDGWVYATHGFANRSKVRAKDGSEVSLDSGSTYRFRPDGSRVEPWTTGQVNPFGMTADPRGYLYTADCHSKPITQLIRGAVYDHFGRPHDGLGYGPHVTRHDHGSTGLCGLAWYHAGHFPADWTGCMFLGNVVTNRVNADRVRWHGSTPEAAELPDFLVSGDPWFRPTDIKLGPDGAIYISDFYNKIIGHYEVDLKHPGRDKDRGRVWRVVWAGADGKAAPPATPFADLTAAPEAELVGLLGAPNLTVRQLAAAQLGARFPAAAAARFAPMSAAEAREKLTAADPHARRAAVDALTAAPSAAAVAPLARLVADGPADDTHLRHAARIALRNALTAENGWEAAAGLAGPAADAATDVAAAVPTPRGAAVLLGLVKAGRADPAYFEHIGRYGTDPMAAEAAAATTALPALRALARGASSRGARLPPAAYAAAADACRSGLDSPDAATCGEAVELAVGLKLADAADRLARLAAGPGRAEGLRGSAVEAVLAVAPDAGVAVAAGLVADGAAPQRLRERSARALGAVNRPAARDALVPLMTTVPGRVAAAAANGLATSADGAAALVAAVRVGKASPRLLQDRGVAAKLAAVNMSAPAAELTRGLPAEGDRLDGLIRLRVGQYAEAKADAAAGQKVFAQHCAACHQVGGVGAKVGPQLDGIGNRGAEAVAEAVLDPSRNVDHAFRTTVLTLVDGRTLSGLLVREEGRVLVLADAAGKEVRVPADDVEERTVSPLSPMPANFDTAIPEAEFAHLLGYLLAQRAKDPAAK